MRDKMQGVRIFVGVFAAALLAGTAYAQRGFRFRNAPVHLDTPPNIAYDGRFTFVRLKYETAPGGYWYRGLPSWAHGYPESEWNLMKILDEVTNLDGRIEQTSVLTLDDPELFTYPVAYFIEAGWWTLSDSEA